MGSISQLRNPGAAVDVSGSALMVLPVLNGGFLRLDYTWSYRDLPQEGSLLLGIDSACWVDTWHISNKLMTCTAQATGISRWSCRGTYSAPPGPDWGWRIDIGMQSSERLRILMFNIWPAGEREELAVEANSSKASRAAS